MKYDEIEIDSIAIGRHVVADLQDVDPALLRDAELLLATVHDALIDAGFTIISEETHRFGAPGFGVTGFLLLSESHAAFHSYPEFRYLALDVFSCGAADPHEAVAAIAARLGARDDCRTLSRRASPA